MGSSKNMIGGLLTSSRAIASRFLWPPERLDVFVSLQAVRPIISNISEIFAENINE